MPTSHPRNPEHPQAMTPEDVQRDVRFVRVYGDNADNWVHGTFTGPVENGRVNYYRGGEDRVYTGSATDFGLVPYSGGDSPIWGKAFCLPEV